MTIDFISAAIKTTLFTGLALAAILVPIQGVMWAFGFLCGTFWGCINLYFIKELVVNLLSQGSKDKLKKYLLLFIKFPLLYFFGYALVSGKSFPPLSLVSGLTLLFGVVFILGLKEYYLEETQ